MTDLLLVHLKNGSSLCMDVQVHRLCQISFHSIKAPVDLTVQLFDLLKLFSSFATFSAAKCELFSKYVYSIEGAGIYLALCGARGAFLKNLVLNQPIYGLFKDYYVLGIQCKDKTG